MITCPLCNANSPAKLKNPDGFCVWKCRNCELIWVPDVSDETLEKFYSREYFNNPDGPMGYHDYLDDEEILRLNARYILSNIPAPKSSHSKILDVGCAYGFLLDEARKRGWNTYGIELNQEAADYAKNHLHLNVTRKMVAQADFPDSTFDCVVMIGTIEHFQDPVAVIKKASRLLKPGGHLAVTTINTKGIVRLFAIKPPEHLYYFSDQNLARLLESHGLKVVKSLPYWCHYHLNEALCRAYRLIFRSDTRIEKYLGSIPLLKKALRVPTNEMFVLSRKSG
jgi:2-polyprenyl-3-methyl-5-hydroxy-6-metoxy-1,4-benzoquinol methylase